MIPKEDLRWYLFEEPVEILKKNGFMYYEEDTLKNLEKYISYYNFHRLTGIASKTFYYIPKFHNKNKNNILLDHFLYKYTNIIDQLKFDFNPIFFGSGLMPFIFSLKKKISYYPMNNIYKDLYDGIININDNLLETSFNNLIIILKNINPKLIILFRDFTPETRLMALVAKELKIPTVEIQHGIYPKKNEIVTGNYVDYVFVWGKYFKNLYLNSEITMNGKIKILGYPHPVKKSPISNTKRVVYLGQNLESYGKRFLENKIDILRELNKLCNNLHLKFLYRPHPADALTKSFNSKEIKFIPKKQDLNHTIKNNEIFISFNSTSLIEAALNSKICIQLNNYDLPCDNFEKMGICKSVTTIKDLERFLKNITKTNDITKFYFPVDKNYIETSHDPGKKFSKLIMNILNE